MSKQIIPAGTCVRSQVLLHDQEKPSLHISEMFSRTLQGEGVNIGVPSTFIRLTNCTLNCTWCDSTEVWRKGYKYNFEEILKLMESDGVIDDIANNHHLVWTGGSPMLQQKQILEFLRTFGKRYFALPTCEIENEGTIMPLDELRHVIHYWNNSLKLSNSGMRKEVRYKPEVIKKLSSFGDQSTFKFVVSSESDWKEIEEDFLASKLIYKNQIILMPCGQNQDELSKVRETVANMCIEHSVRFSDRLHVTLWNLKTGV